METGFGSPSIAGEEEWGFGDPEPAAGASAYPGDTGFGSPYIALEPAQVQVLAPLGQYGDDGGYVVEVLGDWPEQGPYRFRFRDAGGNVYPTTSYCYSGVPTQGESCYTLTGGVDIVTFISPPAPPGAYTLLIEWGPGFGNQISVTGPNAPTVLTRNRSRDVYALRRRLPRHYKAGPLTARQDQLLP